MFYSVDTSHCYPPLFCISRSLFSVDPSEMVLTRSDLKQLLWKRILFSFRQESLTSWLTCWQVRPALSSCCSPGLLDVRGESLEFGLKFSCVTVSLCCSSKGHICAVFFFVCLLPVFSALHLSSSLVTMSTRRRIKAGLEVNFSGEQTLSCRFFPPLVLPARRFLQLLKFIPVFCVAARVGAPLT